MSTIVNPRTDTVAVFASYFKEDGSEVSFEPVVLKMLDEPFDEE